MSVSQSASVYPNSEKKITEEMEQECIEANISVYNNLAECISYCLR